MGNADREPREPAEGPSDGTDRLGSWKEIGVYLGRDVRTVQRWEQTQGLPVHRHRHSRLSTAYAFKSELDAWWHNRPAEPARALPSSPDAPQGADSSSHEASVAGSAEKSGRRGGGAVRVALGLVALLTLGLGGYAWRSSTGPPTLPFEARDFVLIAAFDNRSGDPLFDGTIEYALERELANSTFVNVVPRLRVRDTLELMRKPLDARVDVEIGREVALRDGHVPVLLAGRVEQFGTRYVLTADIVRTADGALTSSVRAEAMAEADVLDAIGRLALDVRRRLGETVESWQGSLPSFPRVATSSLRALQLYTRAWEAMGWNESAPVNTAVAEKLLREAIAIDPAVRAGAYDVGAGRRRQSTAGQDRAAAARRARAGRLHTSPGTRAFAHRSRSSDLSSPVRLLEGSGRRRRGRWRGTTRGAGSRRRRVGSHPSRGA
ncbi:MAG: hypothetical protein ACT4QD_19590 [Acidobacteriota bacterium]